MDWLSQKLAVLFADRMNSYFFDPWQARDDYIDIILNRSPANIESFFSDHAVRTLSKEDKVQVLKLLEMQRNGMLMYTSCGWFFEDISGIASIQIMRYACRAMQLVREVAGDDPEPEFIHFLKTAHSNVPGYCNGAEIYRKYVKTTVVDLSRVGFHYALSSLVADSPERIRIQNYTIQNQAYERAESGVLMLALGKVFLHSDITWEENTLVFAVLYLGNYNIMGGAREYVEEKTYVTMRDELLDGFSKSDIPRMVICLDEYFDDHSYTLWHLFRDGQRKVLSAILDSTLSDMESSFRHMYKQLFPLLSAMKEMQIPPPKILEDPVCNIINLDLKKVLSSKDPDTRRLALLVSEMIQGKFEPDTATLSFTACEAITNLMQRLYENMDVILVMEKITEVFSILSPLNLKYNLWKCQNNYFRIGRIQAEDMQDRARSGDAHAREWVRLFEELGGYLGVKLL